jgi:hypothetical protein
VTASTLPVTIPRFMIGSEADSSRVSNEDVCGGNTPPPGSDGRAVDSTEWLDRHSDTVTDAAHAE